MVDRLPPGLSNDQMVATEEAAGMLIADAVEFMRSIAPERSHEGGASLLAIATAHSMARLAFEAGADLDVVFGMISAAIKMTAHTKLAKLRAQEARDGS